MGLLQKEFLRFTKAKNLKYEDDIFFFLLFLTASNNNLKFDRKG